jgi:hypothetical protein
MYSTSPLTAFTPPAFRVIGSSYHLFFANIPAPNAYLLGQQDKAVEIPRVVAYMPEVIQPKICEKGGWAGKEGDWWRLLV